jgi:23S rRNA (cytidine1920-2'-O)/16S rRNA (cytidine1409-2'-O)-methyltransferase
MFIMGPRLEAFEKDCAAMLGVKHALGVSSGTDALLLALMALGVGEGDEVLLPSFTFFATAGSVARLGASPVWVDVNPHHFNIDLEDAARKVGPRTRAIMPVHLFGQSGDLDALQAFAAAHKHVSRGGHKLDGALNAFTGVVVEGKRCLDAGASTGGFTDVLLRRNAGHVVAVDVGYGQLAWGLRTDERVTVLDRTNIRHLTGDMVGEAIDLVVADLSFISLTLVLPALAAVSKPEADFVLMVKPQFEVGREKLGAGGVVRDPALRKAAVIEVAESAYDVGLGTLGIAASPLPGPAGNVEYFLWLRRGAPEIDHAMLDEAIAIGPQ